jgi:chaperonin GroES
MKFRPLHDRVVIRRVEEEAKTKGGIIIPDNAKEKPQEGEVIAVGPGARDERGQLVPIELKPGDRVLFGKWSGSEVKIDAEDLLIMQESEGGQESRLNDSHAPSQDWNRNHVRQRPTFLRRRTRAYAARRRDSE